MFFSPLTTTLCTTPFCPLCDPLWITLHLSVCNRFHIHQYPSTPPRILIRLIHHHHHPPSFYSFTKDTTRILHCYHQPPFSAISLHHHPSTPSIPSSTIFLRFHIYNTTRLLRRESLSVNSVITINHNLSADSHHQHTPSLYILTPHSSIVLPRYSAVDH